MSVARSVLAAHRHPAEAGRGRAAGAALRPVHVAFGRDAAPLVLAAFASLGRSRFQPDVVVAATGWDACAADLPRAAATWIADARRAGARVALPGEGRAGRVYRERWAAPGRLAVVADHDAAACGAFGVLAFPADAIETAAVLIGGPLLRDPGSIRIVQLRGGLGSWVSGTDLVLALARRSREPVDVIEFAGAGVGALRMADRIAIAACAAAMGGRTVLFPSDETTRRAYQSLGREADWKRIEVEIAEREPALEVVDLDAVEPAIAPIGDPSSARPVRQAAGAPIRRIVIGPEVALADIARLARILAGRRVAAGVDVRLDTGGRLVEDTARERGLLTELAAAGVAIDSAPAGTATGAALAGTGLCFGAGPDDLMPASGTWWLASLETCAATALTGQLADPRQLEVEFRRDEEPETTVRRARGTLEPAAADTDGVAPAAAFPSARPLGGPVRGSVLLKLGDHVAVADVLPRGARLAPLAADLPALATRTFVARDPAFAARAARHGGGFVVAGHECGWGAPRIEAALALAQLGIRAVLARSFDLEFRRGLLEAGVLPLRLRVESDYHAISAGDEVELPGMPETFEAGKPLVLRNLTHGTQMTLWHDLDARGVDVARVGGMLRYAHEVAEEVASA